MTVNIAIMWKHTERIRKKLEIFTSMLAKMANHKTAQILYPFSMKAKCLLQFEAQRLVTWKFIALII